MKVFIRYEDNNDESAHKTLKITLPRSWKNGPTSRLLGQFVESYNAGKEGQSNPLDASSLHLAIRSPSTDSGNENASNTFKDLPSDGIVLSTISDRDDVFVIHGPSRTLSEIQAERTAQLQKEREELSSMSKCVHFGCSNRFPKGGPYPNCRYHSGPPVFHETAKFWSCCPNKKAYDWDEFQSLPTCQSGVCTDVKEESGSSQKQFLGGCDLREQLGGGASKLRSIDDFNTSIAAGGSASAPVMERLRSVLGELGVETELFDQVINGLKKEIKDSGETVAGEDDAKIVDEAMKILGGKLKSAMKAIAADQLRIK